MGALLSRGKRSFRSDTSTADWSRAPSASEKGSQNDNDGPRIPKTIPSRRPSQRETELMELLRRVEKGDDGNAFPRGFTPAGGMGKVARPCLGGIRDDFVV